MGDLFKALMGLIVPVVTGIVCTVLGINGVVDSPAFFWGVGTIAGFIGGALMMSSLISREGL